MGYTRAEALAPTWFPGNLHPEDRGRVIRERREFGERGKGVHEFRFRHRNGEYRWFREDLRRLEAGLGGPPRVVGVADGDGRASGVPDPRQGLLVEALPDDRHQLGQLLVPTLIARARAPVAR